MLALRIIATVFVSISVFTGVVKNASAVEDNNFAFLLFTLWGLLWRAFVIVALWVI